jgi:hypothetical protein
MAASIIEQVLARVQAALLGATAAGARVERGRVDALGLGEVPALIVRRSRTDSTPHARGLDHQLITFEVDIEVRGADWETQADALHVDVDTVLVNDPALAQLAQGLYCTGTDATAEAGDETAGRITARYQAQTLTRRGDLTRTVS